MLWSCIHSLRDGGSNVHIFSADCHPFHFRICVESFHLLTSGPRSPEPVLRDVLSSCIWIWNSFKWFESMLLLLYSPFVSIIQHLFFSWYTSVKNSDPWSIKVYHGLWISSRGSIIRFGCLGILWISWLHPLKLVSISSSTLNLQFCHSCPCICLSRITFFWWLHELLMGVFLHFPFWWLMTDIIVS